MRDCVLTIDLGTTACKAVLFSPEGMMVAETSVHYPTWHPDAERAEQHPDDWWNAASAAVRKVLTEASDVQVRVISLSSQRETILPVDEHLRPVHSALVWMDTRGVHYVRRMEEKYGERLRRWTGLVPYATYSAGKILWLRHEHPELTERTRYFLQPKDYLLYRMSGVIATDCALASRTMLFNIHTLDWQGELLAECGISARQLPPVHPSDTEIARLNYETAIDWGLPAHIPIILGGGDRACEVLGSGIQSGEAMESTGTTSNIAIPVTQPVAESSHRVICSVHVLQGHWILEQGMSTTGAIVDWLSSQAIRDMSYTDLDDLLTKSPPGASGLIALPFFMGARAPRWDPLARGAIIGLTLSHTPADLLRSVVEGIGYELRYAIQVYEEMGIQVDRVRLIGAGARQRTWNQTKADIYQKRLASPRVVHAASFGAFLLAAKYLGWIDTYQDGQKLNPLDAIYHPDQRTSEVYTYGYEVYAHLYRQLEGTWSMFHKYSRGQMGT